MALALIWIVGSYVEAHRYLSPCPDSGCHVMVKTVYASDENTELEQVIGYITKVFQKEGPQVVYQAISVAKNESGWRKDAKGWNCHYLDENGKQYSDACKIEDRPKAWSVDCGIMQINVNGQVCPEKLLTIKHNVNKAYAMYKTRKWNPWVAAKSLGYTN